MLSTSSAVMCSLSTATASKLLAFAERILHASTATAAVQAIPSDPAGTLVSRSAVPFHRGCVRVSKCRLTKLVGHAGCVRGTNDTLVAQNVGLRSNWCISRPIIRPKGCCGGCRQSHHRRCGCLRPFEYSSQHLNTTAWGSSFGNIGTTLAFSDGISLRSWSPTSHP